MTTSTRSESQRIQNELISLDQQLATAVVATQDLYADLLTAVATKQPLAQFPTDIKKELDRRAVFCFRVKYLSIQLASAGNLPLSFLHNSQLIATLNNALPGKYETPHVNALLLQAAFESALQYISSVLDDATTITTSHSTPACPAMAENPNPNKLPFIDQIPIFANTPDYTISNYLLTVEEIGSLSGMTDEKLRQVALMRTTPSVKEIIRNMPEAKNQCDWTTFKQALLDRFGTRVSTATIRSNLFACEQSATETAVQFGDRISLLASQLALIYPTADAAQLAALKGQLERDKTETFIRGIRDHTAKMLLKSHAPQDIPAALKLLKQMDADGPPPLTTAIAFAQSISQPLAAQANLQPSHPTTPSVVEVMAVLQKTITDGFEKLNLNRRDDDQRQSRNYRRSPSRDRGLSPAREPSYRRDSRQGSADSHGRSEYSRSPLPRSRREVATAPFAGNSGVAYDRYSSTSDNFYSYPPGNQFFSSYASRYPPQYVQPAPFLPMSGYPDWQQWQNPPFQYFYGQGPYNNNWGRGRGRYGNRRTSQRQQPEQQQQQRASTPPPMVTFPADSATKNAGGRTPQ